MQLSADLKKKSQQLMGFCHGRFVEAISTKELPDKLLYGSPVQNTLIYKYPETLEPLIQIAGLTVDELTKLGWYQPDLCGQYFVIWFSGGRMQLCPINLEQMNYGRPAGGLNSEYPYLYSFIRRQADSIDYACLVESPIYATLLTAKGVPTLALGSGAVRKKQIKALGNLGIPLYFIDTIGASSERNAEITALSLLRLCELHILFIEQWPTFIHKTLESIEEALAQRCLGGTEFLVERVLHKNNGKGDYERAVEVMQCAAQIGPLNARMLLNYAKDQSNIKLLAFSESLRFMADLIESEIHLQDARTLVQKRFGVSIYLKSHNGIELF